MDYEYKCDIRKTRRWRVCETSGCLPRRFCENDVVTSVMLCTIKNVNMHKDDMNKMPKFVS